MSELVLAVLHRQLGSYSQQKQVLTYSVLRPYYIMRCFTCVLDFSRVFPGVYDTKMLVFKTRMKTQEKCKKNMRKSKTRAQREKMFLYYTMRWAKNSSQLLAFSLRFAHKPYQNANPKHSVLWALVENKFGLF